MLTPDEAKKLVPHLSSAKFLTEDSVRSRDTDCETIGNMFDQKGWTIVGWAYSRDVFPRFLKPYVLMFEDEAGIKRWFHVEEATLLDLVNDLKQKKK